ncbi:hypothetical protein [Sphingomonas solaris]|uniref:Vgr related protein n=1 Tax=Alterirhizorhabdus solaris TaxID=2529389 RepID=A0A558RCZ5_9SPHN|nr:hypothetical protein [Sphingomonas solaris]TVV77246.1 hypothetical protein FOY91_01545 [Sphingomonas solaris]
MIDAMFGTTRGIASARIFPFNFWWPYPNDRAMTPDGSIYFPRRDYRDDFSAPTVSISLRALFLHEATHLYQTYVLGYYLMLSGPFDRNYEYTLVAGKRLEDYGIEQMGQMVQDYYRLIHGVSILGGVYMPDDYRDALPVRTG